MVYEACDCCQDAATGPETDHPRDARVLTDTAVMHADLPEDLQAALGSFVGEASVDTLADWVATVRAHLDGSIAPEDLCHTDVETGHWGRVDGDTHHFQCFYDAVALSAFVDQDVDIRTESPEGAVVRATAAVDDSELSVTPEDAVFSFGIADDPVSENTGEPTLEAVYASVCPYVKAFPSVEAYERWAATVPAATVATPLAGATELAEALVA